jgi:hypothetical protein
VFRRSSDSSRGFFTSPQSLVYFTAGSDTPATTSGAVLAGVVGAAAAGAGVDTGAAGPSTGACTSAAGVLGVLVGAVGSVACSGEAVKGMGVGTGGTTVLSVRGPGALAVGIVGVSTGVPTGVLGVSGVFTGFLDSVIELDLDPGFLVLLTG